MAIRDSPLEHALSPKNTHFRARPISDRAQTLCDRFTVLHFSKRQSFRELSPPIEPEYPLLLLSPMAGT